MKIIVVFVFCNAILCLNGQILDIYHDSGYLCMDNNQTKAEFLLSNDLPLKNSSSCSNSTWLDALNQLKSSKVSELSVIGDFPASSFESYAAEFYRDLSDIPNLRTLNLSDLDLFPCETALLLSKPFTIYLPRMRKLDIRCMEKQLFFVLDYETHITSDTKEGRVEIHLNFYYNNLTIVSRTDQLGFVGEFMRKTQLHIHSLELSGSSSTDLDFSSIKDIKNLYQLRIGSSNIQIVKNPELLESSAILGFDAQGNQIQNAVEIIQHLNPSIVDLDLSDSFIGELNATTLNRLTNLRTLRLANTQLKILGSNPFGQLKKLWTLDISGNNLSELNFSALSTLEHLWVFRAANCQIRNAIDLFSYFGSSLWILDLSNNFIGPINVTTFKHLTDLQSLYLGNTSLLLPDSDPFANLIWLFDLDISYNDLSKFNFAILSPTLVRVRHFKAAGCQINITAINTIIAHFGSFLQSLDLSDNFIGNLNAIKFDEPSLLELSLRNTSFSIGDTNPFSKLKRLRGLDISQNNLKSLNFTVLSPTLERLEFFNAAGSQMENASSVIEHLAEVVHLDLSGNSFEEFDFGALKHPERIEELNISYNQLKTLNISSRMGRLRSLDLRGNELTKIDNFDKHHLPALRRLAISENRFSCEVVNKIEKEWPTIEFIDNAWKQCNLVDVRNVT